MTPALDRQRDDLEARAVGAHRAYVVALVALEDAIHRRSKAMAAADREAFDDGADFCHEAELRKEACRIAFRDLIDQLGYVPKGQGIALPSEPDFDGRQVET